MSALDDFLDNNPHVYCNIAIGGGVCTCGLQEAQIELKELRTRIKYLEELYATTNPEPAVKESQVYLHKILNRTDVNWLPEAEEK